MSIKNGFMTVVAGDGAPYIKITFPDLAQAHAAHAELLAATQPPTGEAASEAQFLVICHGDNYNSEIVPQSRLDEAYLLTQFSSIEDIDDDTRREMLERFHDPEEWLQQDHLPGSTSVEFKDDFEDGWVRVIRLPATQQERGPV